MHSKVGAQRRLRECKGHIKTRGGGQGRESSGGKRESQIDSVRTAWPRNEAATEKCGGEEEGGREIGCV